MTGSEPDFDKKQAGEAEQEDEELDSSPDSEEPERDSDEPPEPVAEDHPQPDEDRWGIGSRVLAVVGLVELLKSRSEDRGSRTEDRHGVLRSSTLDPRSSALRSW